MTNPKPQLQAVHDLVQRYFIENRSRVLELAAFLDRVARASAGQYEGTVNTTDPDHRMDLLKKSLAALADPRPDKVQRIQILLSDPTEAPLESAPLEKSAQGVPTPNRREMIHCC